MSTAPLNEAFASTILQQLWANPMAKKVFLHILKQNPKIDINKIVNGDFYYLDGKSAAKMNGDSLWKFWTNAGPSQTLMITHSNSLFDKWFEVKRNRRDTRSIVGSSAMTDQVYMDYAELGKNYINSFKACYVLDVKALAAKNDRGAVVAGRKESRKGAVALMSDSEIKKQNIARYVEQIRKNKISDGSEFNLINSVTKYFDISIKKNGPILFLFYLAKEGFITNYLAAYSDLLMESIKLLNRNGMVLKDGEVSDKYEWFLTEESKYKTLRDKLSKAADNVINYLKRDLKWEYVRKGIDIIINDPKTTQDFYEMLKSSPKITNADDFLELVNFIRSAQKTIPTAFGNPNISHDLLNFDTFVMQLHGLRQIRDSISPIDEILSDVASYAALTKQGKDVNEERLGYRVRQINLGMFRRIESFIKMIGSI